MSFGSLFLIKHTHARSSNNQMNLLSLSSLLLLGLIRIRSTHTHQLYFYFNENNPKKNIVSSMSNSEKKKNRCLVSNPHTSSTINELITALIWCVHILHNKPDSSHLSAISMLPLFCTSWVRAQ